MADRHLILVVDDHRPTAIALKKVLNNRKPSWEILLAHSVEDAKQTIETHHLDAVVTDWRLNEQDQGQTGFQVVEAMHRRDPWCVSILITGYPEALTGYEKAFPMSVYDCISKNARGVVVVDELCIKLDAALKRRRAHQDANFYARHIDHRLRLSFGTTLDKSRITSRWLTIMFTDIRGFSAVANQLRTEKEMIADFLQQLYAATVDCAHKHDGIVDKFMGDGAMLLFGVDDDDNSSKNRRHTKNAVRAALDLRKRCGPIIESFREQAAGMHAAQIAGLDLGIGINTAEVLVGIIKTELRDQFTALGHGVNLAQRFESIAGKSSSPNAKHRYGNILITSMVESRIRGDFVIKVEPSLANLRNINEPHDVWSVVREVER